jgi:Putative zinc-finger
MGISCQEVWKDVSDYIDNELETFRRAALDQHFAGCRHCTALLFAALSVRRLVLPGHESRSPATEPDKGELPDAVAISQDHDDKVYHVAGCSHLIGKTKFLALKEAISEGDTPCAYCISSFLLEG